MKKKAWYKKWWIWVILGVASYVVLLGLVGACSVGLVETEISGTDFTIIEETKATQLASETKTETKHIEETTIKETQVKTETAVTESKVETVAEETYAVDTYYEKPSTDAESYIEEYVEEETEEEYYVPIVEEEPEDNGRNYVLNNNSYKFHYPSCSSVNRIKSYNREDYFGTRDELISMGYEPCGNCHP